MIFAWLDWPQTQTLVQVIPELRFVGGAVRDSLLGLPVKDVDASSPLLPEEVMQRLEKVGIRAIPTGLAHGTVTAVIDKKSFEITTLRKDVATDGRHAQVHYTDDWKEDAGRRDFTMNALYLTPTGELFDYFGGEKDAKEGRVQFIGEPAARIAEDYLRILRFFRFFAHYGKGEPDGHTLSICKLLAPHLDSLSGERIQQEMFKLFAAEKPFTAVTHMQESAVLAVACGFKIVDLAPIAQLEAIGHVTPLTYLAALLLKADIAPALALEKLSARWALPNEHKKLLAMLLDYHGELTATTEVAAQKRLIRKIGAEAFAKLVCLQAAFSGGLSPVLDAMLDLAVEWQVPVFPVTGEDLKARGFAEGKALGDKLKKLEERWESSDYKLSREQLLQN